jgi:hypothetical protein
MVLAIDNYDTKRSDAVAKFVLSINGLNTAKLNMMIDLINAAGGYANPNR